MVHKASLEWEVRNDDDKDIVLGVLIEPSHDYIMMGIQSGGTFAIHQQSKTDNQ